MSALDDFMVPADNIIWYITFLILIPLGIYFTIKLRCLQIRNLDESCKVTVKSADASKDGRKRISSLESFLMSLGARIGVGNIAGVASAIMIGGPGAIFWMWVFTIVISVLGFAEAVASQMYKERNEDGIYAGGPPFYAKKAFKNHRLAIGMAILLIVLYGLAVLMVNVSIGVNQVKSFSPNDTTTIIIMIVAIGFMSAIVLGGIKEVANACKLLVPVMIIAWVAICAITLVVNWQNIGNAFYMIFHYAFTIPDGLDVNGFLSIEGVFDGLKGPIGGLLGTVIVLALRKCVFSNEAGVGSISVLSGSAECSHPVKLGYMQSFAVLIDTLIICTLTAVTVLSFGDFQALMDTGLTDAPLVSKVISDAFLGSSGGIILGIILLVCVLSSVITMYGIVETTSTILSKNKQFLNALKAMTIIAMIVGCLIDLQNAYAFTEILMALCTIPHIIMLFKLRKNIFAAYRDYHDQKKKGIEEPKFHKDAVPDQEGITEWD